MKKAVLTVAHSVNLVQSISKGITDRELFFSYGDVIPDLTNYDTIYWMGGLYAAQLQELGFAAQLCSPGSAWLAELNPEFTGRKITATTFKEMPEFSDRMWVKPAEAKVKSLALGRYSYSELKDIFLTNSLSGDIHLQWTDSFLNLDYEHRFFIRNGEVIAGSPYLVKGVGFHPGIDSSELFNAQEFAQHVETSNVGDTPPAYVLDVALDMDRNEWLVVEANRAWSSGFYGCDPMEALKAVETSCSYKEDRWAWRSDPHLKALVKDMTPMQIVSAEEDHTGFVRYVKP